MNPRPLRGRDIDEINNSYYIYLLWDIDINTDKFTLLRIEIPKQKGGYHYLNIGSPHKKIVQEVIIIILNSIFNNTSKIGTLEEAIMNGIPLKKRGILYINYIYIKDKIKYYI